METLLQVIEKCNQRVLTTQQLASVYKTDEKKLRDNFSNNRSRYIEGKHFFRVEGEELRSLKHSTENFGAVGINANSTYLWTELGALHHAKSLGTDKAWEVFEELELNYFRSRQSQYFKLPLNFAEALRELAITVESNEKLSIENVQMKPKAEFYDAVAGSKDAIEMAQVSKVLAIKGYGRNNLFDFLREVKVLDKNNIPMQKYVDSGYFRVLEQKFTKNNGEILINIKTLVYQKGIDFIKRLIIQRGTIR